MALNSQNSAADPGHLTFAAVSLSFGQDHNYRHPEAVATASVRWSDGGSAPPHCLAVQLLEAADHRVALAGRQ